MAASSLDSTDAREPDFEMVDPEAVISTLNEHLLLLQQAAVALTT
jgi:hypothetical protein